jgi:hypothetical protein
MVTVVLCSWSGRPTGLTTNTDIQNKKERKAKQRKTGQKRGTANKTNTE